jgi:hypothetical protein
VLRGTTTVPYRDGEVKQEIQLLEIGWGAG